MVFDQDRSHDRQLRGSRVHAARWCVSAIVMLTKGGWPLIRRRLTEIATAVAAATPGRAMDRVPTRATIRAEGRMKLRAALAVTLMTTGLVTPTLTARDDGQRLLLIDHYVRVKSTVPSMAGQIAQIYVRDG